MTTTATRTCIRGCTIPSEHFATCLDGLGQPTEGCRGCAPVEARDGDLLCSRCYGRSLGALYDAADVIAAIRAHANPLKANVYDKVLVSRSLDGIPAPVNADFVDAPDALLRGLQGWAEWAEPATMPKHHGLRAGTEPPEARVLARQATSVLIDAWPRIANDANVVELCRFLLDQGRAEHLTSCADMRCTGCVSAAFWTIRAALNRWPLVERPWYAAQPCPDCSLRTVRVTEPRRPPKSVDGAWIARDPQVYECTNPACQWVRSDVDDDGPWHEVFSRRMVQPQPTAVG